MKPSPRNFSNLINQDSPTQYSEGSDEDITGSDMAMSTTSKPKVQPFYTRLIIDTFDELVMHHKACIFSFSKLLMDQGKGLIAYGMHGRLKKLIGDQIQVILTSSTRPSHHFWPKERKSPSQTRFWSWIRTAEHSQLATVTSTSYGLRLGCSITF